MICCSITKKILSALASIGAINWGLYGISGIDAVALLFGAFSPLARFVYIVVGIAGLYILLQLFMNNNETTN